MNKEGKESTVVNNDFEQFYNEELKRQERREAELIKDMENYREWYHQAVTEKNGTQCQNRDARKSC